mgnify:FL=1
MDETREIMYQRQRQRERGEYPDAGISIENTVQEKAKIIRLFYIALLTEGFSEQEALNILVQAPV